MGNPYGGAVVIWIVNGFLGLFALILGIVLNKKEEKKGIYGDKKVQWW